MPEISRFFGIVITMYYNDHDPPHFHVRYAQQHGIIAIDPLEVVAGRLSQRVQSLVIEWAEIHQDELRVDWELARRRAALNPIEPLE
jgi:hypothetical protein